MKYRFFFRHSRLSFPTTNAAKCGFRKKQPGEDVSELRQVEEDDIP